MNFEQAIRSGFKNYIGFTGRATRSEFWYWTLFAVVVQLLVDLVTADKLEVVSALVSLALFLPSLSVSIRRLHDIDKSGWWFLLWFVPIVGWIVMIYWACCQGSEGPNRFGPDFLSVTPAEP
jgi:uncharacterized membrane protein YhaH (DUF805 family)